MRILVISDSHGRGNKIEQAIIQQPTAKHIFFLGDVTSDIEDLQLIFSDRIFHVVSGNCDFCSFCKKADIAEIEGKRILFTHGHLLGVKYTTEHLLKKALEENCDIALYGHTHVSNILYENGVYIVNPGSCAEARAGHNSYAVIDILPSGILPAIIEL